jgi:hypothetical protein
MSRATATAEPPEEPPATRSKSLEFFVGPKYEFSVEEPCAKESRFVRPIMIAPSFSNLSTAVAVTGLVKPWRMCAEAVVSPSGLRKLSFRAYGTPARRPTFSPFLIRSSISAAFLIAPTSFRKVKI